MYTFARVPDSPEREKRHAPNSTPSSTPTATSTPTGKTDELFHYCVESDRQMLIRPHFL